MRVKLQLVMCNDEGQEETVTDVITLNKNNQRIEQLGLTLAEAKELANNKFPISCAFWNGAVVPFGQVVVKDDWHILFEIGGVFTPSVVHRVQHPHCHPQPGHGVRTLDALPRNVHRVEDHPLAGTGDVREHLVFNRIVLGTVRRIVSHPNLGEC